MRSLLNLGLISIMFIFSVTSFGEAPKSMSVTAAATKAPQSDLYVPHFSLSYGMNTDLATQTSPRLLTHAWDLGAGMSLTPELGVETSLGLKYFSLDTTIPNRSSNLNFDDLNLGLLYHGKIGNRFLILSELEYIFPTSEASQFEGYKGIGLGLLGANIKLYRNIYSMSHRVAGGYIFNTYDSSPTNLQSNPETFVSYQLGNSFSLLEQLKITFGFGIKSTHLINGADLLNFNNTESLEYRVRKWSASINYTNGGYSDQTAVDLWFIDRYRQVIMLKVSYEI